MRSLLIQVDPPEAYGVLRGVALALVFGRAEFELPVVAFATGLFPVPVFALPLLIPLLLLRFETVLIGVGEAIVIDEFTFVFRLFALLLALFAPESPHPLNIPITERRPRPIIFRILFLFPCDTHTH
jgi:hypothetical protein